MYRISQVSEVTGVSTHTLRYYEKMGLLPSPERKNGGVRMYTESDIHFIEFLNSLKNTGMSLEDIAEFVKDGCILKSIEEGRNTGPSINKRTEILLKHVRKMEAQRAELDKIILLTQEKLAVYHTLLAQNQEGDTDEN